MAKNKKAEKTPVTSTPSTFEQVVDSVVESVESETPTEEEVKKFATGEKPIKPFILAFLNDGPKGKAEIFQHVKKERGGSTARTVIYKMLKTKSFKLTSDGKYETA
jgi:hypothetical protein